MNINYEYYRIFYYVAKYGNMTQAAQALCNNQPNISRTVRLLEHALGCTLLIRSNRGIVLTPEGERLFAHVKIAVEQLMSAEEELSLSSGLMNGVVTVGTSETALRMVLLPALNAFRSRYPGVQIRIRSHLTTPALESVKNGLVDFAVVVIHNPVERPLTAHLVFTFRDIIIGGSAYAQLHKSPVSLAELSGLPLISLGENTITYDLYEQFYHSHQLPFRPELEAATADQVLPMIKGNLGIGFLPELYAREALDKGEIFQLSLTEPLPLRQVSIVENERSPLSRAARELKKYCCQVADPERSGPHGNSN